MTSVGVLIRDVRLLDPSMSLNKQGDLLIVDGRIQGIGSAIRDGEVPSGVEVISGKGLVACPGFIDLHTHLREPGYEDKETIATGVMAAARGGFTTICCMPNTNPPIDNVSVLQNVCSKAKMADSVRVLPIGCVSKGREGKHLAELNELASAGAVAFSDDGSPVIDANLMRQALSYVGILGVPVIDHCEDLSLSRMAPVNEGWLSNRLGLKGWPAVAEEVIVARDIALADVTGGRLHLAHLSTAGSVDLVRRAKERGVNVTAEVTPHHLTMDEGWVIGRQGGQSHYSPLTRDAYDTNTKVNPPLRTQKDLEALIIGLRDGVIDAVATDHAPHAIADKFLTYDDASFGISGLETAVGMLMGLVHKGELTLEVLVERLTSGPARVLGAEYHSLETLRKGTTADMVLLDPEREWVVRSSDFASKGKNTPLEGMEMRGGVVATFVGGRLVHSIKSNS